MMEWSVITVCYAAMAAFRAVEPARLEAEAGLGPAALGATERQWRRGLRVAASGLLVLAVGLAWHLAGPFEGLLVAAAATMASTIGLTLGAPVAGRVVWGAAAICVAATPVLVAVTLVYGGGHG